jgi:hypothetical protein
MNFQEQVENFSSIVQCGRCLNDPMILRNKKNIPQPGYIGSEYERYRICFIGQNPGEADPDKTKWHVNHAQAESAFLVDPNLVNFERLYEALKHVLPYYSLVEKYVIPILQGCNLSQDNIAFFNVARCQTKNDVPPSREMRLNCM